MKTAVTVKKRDRFTCLPPILIGYVDGRSASYSQADFMVTVAELELNQAHIGLVG
jgi:hypothetical protein